MSLRRFATYLILFKQLDEMKTFAEANEVNLSPSRYAIMQGYRYSWGPTLEG